MGVLDLLKSPLAVFNAEFNQGLGADWSRGDVLALAGLWETWTDPESDEAIQSLTLVTTTPNEVMAPIHDRMPVVIRDQDRSLWLDHHDEDTEGAIACIERLQDDFEVYPVSKKVNAARYDEPDLIRPI